MRLLQQEPQSHPSSQRIHVNVTHPMPKQKYSVEEIEITRTTPRLADVMFSYQT
jgi:hypothetical protein